MIGYLLPGQGTQKVGMFQMLGSKSDEVEDIFRVAEEATGRDVLRLCKEATESELKQTLNTQICVTAMNMAYYKLLMNRDVIPDIVAGHSLGQFSALAIAGVISIYDLFRIVNKRAQLMSYIKTDGSLATIIGVDKNTVAKVCNDISDENGSVAIALENSNIQLVIGGNEAYVKRATEILKRAGAIKIVEVKVSNAFHTPLMEPMVKLFMEFINGIEFHKPSIKLLLNTTGDYVTEIDEIVKEIKNQCTNVVRWNDCMTHMLEHKNLLLAEVGIGKTMSGLVRNRDRMIHTYTVSDNKEFDLFVKEVKKVSLCLDNVREIIA